MSTKKPQAKAASSEAKPAPEKRQPSPAPAKKSAKGHHRTKKKRLPVQPVPAPKRACGIPGRKEVEWHAIFIAALAEGPYITHACAKANVARQTAYSHREEFPQFAAQWDAALKAGMERLPDVLEATAYERAVHGVTRYKYDKEGNVIGEYQEHSDVLLKCLLAGNAPAKFGEKLDLTGTEKFIPLDELKRRVREGK